MTLPERHKNHVIFKFGDNLFIRHAILISESLIIIKEPKRRYVFGFYDSIECEPLKEIETKL